jgi:lipopolysaccharide transport system permease protein
MTETSSQEHWDLVLKPTNKWYDVRLKQVWRYRDLLMMFVKRDFVSVYKQTILGPLWLFIQPILTTITFTIIFGNIAKIGTGGTPSVLFYMAGLTLWAYFSDCITKTSNTFVTNANVFGKVYFPRLIMPLSILVSNLIKLGIQFLLFFIIWLFYYFTTDVIKPNVFIVLLPLLVLIMAGLGLGFGLIISALTTKYRDLSFLITFGVQLLMYITPVVYPLSIVSEKYKIWLLLNPLTSIIETFKYAFIGVGYFDTMLPWLGYSFLFMLVIVSLGVIIFNKVEKSFMDTV